MAQRHLVLLSLQAAQVGQDRSVTTSLVAPDLHTVLPHISIGFTFRSNAIGDFYIAGRVSYDQKGSTFALCILEVVLVISDEQSDVLQPIFFARDLLVIVVSEKTLD